MESRLPNTKSRNMSALRNSNEAHPPKSTFIAPFIKNEHSESPKGTALKDNIRTPSAFVPPFKKLRNCSKTEEVEDKHNFVAPFTNHSSAPSTKKCSGSVTGNKLADNTLPVTFAEMANDKLLMSPHHQVACGSEDAAAEEDRGKQAL